MKIQLTQPNLFKALSIMSRVASNKTELPVLNNVLIKTTAEGVQFSATNLEVAVTHHAAGKVNQEGQVAVPARLFHDFVAQLPKDQTVTLNIEKNKLLVKSGAYSSHIQSVNPEDFPALPEISTEEKLTVATHDLKETLDRTLVAASHDETRPILGGVFIHTHEKSLYFTATDGYRLAESKSMDTETEMSSVVPSQALQDVLKILQDTDEESVEVFSSEGQFAVRAGNTQLVSRLVEGVYPEYRKLIPTKSEVSLEVNKSDFHTAAKLAGLFARESGGSITITASEEDQSVTVASVASQVGDNNSAVPAKVIGDGEIVLNVKYLSDALNCFTARSITFRFGDSIAPCVLSSSEDEGYQHVVMPLKS